jgi:hypothetical protein
MTHIETTRYTDVIGLQIGAVREISQRLHEKLAVEELEAIIAELEGTMADLKESLAGIPHKRS